MPQPVTRRTLCNALGFLAVILRDDPGRKNYNAADAHKIAGLLEGYCALDAVPQDDGLPPGARFDAAQRMAAEIVALLEKRQGCTQADLLAEGFRQDEVDRYWPLAWALAQVQISGGV